MPPKFSIVLIVRNEVHTLPKMFASLKEFQARGGEVVIVDTGSKDGTADVARVNGAKVTEVGDRFRTTFDAETVAAVNARFVEGGEAPILKEGDSIFSFADARNFAASLATNDFVFCLDGDEALTALDIDAVNARIEAGLGQAEYEFVFSHDYMGNPAVHFKQCKGYDRRKLQWKGIIHECISPIPGAEPALVEYLPPTIYKNEHWQNEKTDRTGYLRGLAYDCFKNPENDRNSHYFGRELFYCNRPKSAIKELKRHVEMKRWPAERAMSMIFIGDCLTQLGAEHEATVWYHAAFDAEPNRREPLMRLAWQSHRHEQHQKTACYAAAALEIPWNDFYANAQAQYTHEPHELLYHALWWLGDRVRSKIHFDKALDYLPYHQKFLNDTKYYYEYGDPMIEGWMRFRELTWLYETAKDMESVIEIGSWAGKSTHALLSGCKGTVTAVDHWEGSGEGDKTGDIAKERDMHAVFMKNVGAFLNLKVMKMPSEDAAAQAPEADMVFIDGTHTYEGVKRDIELWRGKAKKILCGHDYDPVNWPGTVKAVDEAFGKPDRVVDSIWIKYVHPEADNLNMARGDE